MVSKKNKIENNELPPEVVNDPPIVETIEDRIYKEDTQRIFFENNQNDYDRKVIYKVGDKNRPVLMTERVEMIPIDMLYTFPDHPFPVEDNEALNELMQSIQENGIREPLLVINRYRGEINEDNDGSGYYIVSGHRRRLAAKNLGIERVPCMIKDWDMDNATQAMVETNIHRPDSEITPMAKARAYEMYMVANKKKVGKKKGLEDRNAIENEMVGNFPTITKTREDLARITGEDARYIDKIRNLLCLIPYFQDAVDGKKERKIPLAAAFDLSFITDEGQEQICKVYDEHKNTKLSINTAKQLRRVFDLEQKPTDQDILEIITVEKKAQKSLKITFDAEEIEQFFPGMNAKEIKEFILSKM